MLDISAVLKALESKESSRDRKHDLRTRKIVPRGKLSFFSKGSSRGHMLAQGTPTIIRVSLLSTLTPSKLRPLAVSLTERLVMLYGPSLWIS